MEQKKFLSTVELADILGISRVAVFKKIKEGKIKAMKVGRNFIIDRSELEEILGKVLKNSDKKEIDNAVRRTVLEYGETLKKLGKE
jgi:excisionase family DNA binding protein